MTRVALPVRGGRLSLAELRAGILSCLDPHHAPAVRAALAEEAHVDEDALPSPSGGARCFAAAGGDGATRHVGAAVAGLIVLGGQRAAGKSSLLPWLSRWLERPGLDLDEAIAQSHGRSLAAWVRDDTAGFRTAERDAFLAAAPGQIVAVGGGFLEHHADVLANHTVVIVPVTEETYRARLLADRSRPRLLPALALEEELAVVYRRREMLHARIPHLTLADFLRRARREETA